MWIRWIGYIWIIVFIVMDGIEGLLTSSKVTRYWSLTRAAMQVGFLVLYVLILKRDTHSIQMRDEFLGVASHELKTPLTAIYLCLQLLHKKDLTPKERGLVKRSLESCEMMNRTIRTFLDVHNLEKNQFPLERSRTDLIEIIKAVLEANQVTPEKLKINLPKELQLMVDQDRIFQVLNNLLSNAIKYGEGQPVDIEATTEGNYAVIKISDQGIGIHEAEQRKIFESFKRGSNTLTIPGTGLGLYITQQIVKAHGGIISVESSHGKGSTFTVKLPLV